MKDGLLPCSRLCRIKDVSCPHSECKHWIDFKEDKNCCLIAIYEHGPMTLRKIAERIGLSFARVKQIETAALKKIKNTSRGNSFLFWGI